MASLPRITIRSRLPWRSSLVLAFYRVLGWFGVRQPECITRWACGQGIWLKAGVCAWWWTELKYRVDVIPPAPPETIEIASSRPGFTVNEARRYEGCVNE